MPLYDCMLLLKPHVSKEAIMDLVSRIGKHVYRRNGVLTDVKSFVSSPSVTHSSGTIQLGYGIKKLDGRYYQKSAEVFPILQQILGHKFFYLLKPFNEVLSSRRELSSQSDYPLVCCVGPHDTDDNDDTAQLHTELYYLNKEDRLLRWLYIKHRDIKFRDDFLDDEDTTSELRSFRGNIFDDDEDDDGDDDGEHEDEPSEPKGDVGP